MLLSVPIVLSQLLQVAYDLIDTYWLGQLGAAAVSMISFSWLIIFLMISLVSGFTVAGTTLVSQNEGAGDHAAANHVAGQTIVFTLVGRCSSLSSGTCSRPLSSRSSARRQVLRSSPARWPTPGRCFWACI